MEGIFDDGYHWCVDEVTRDIVDGKMILPELVAQYNIYDALKNLKAVLPEGTNEKDRADYERGMKIMIVRPVINRAWQKMMPVLASGILEQEWKTMWRKFVVTQIWL